MQETLVQLLGREDPWRRDRLPIPVFLGFSGGSAGKEAACIVWDLGLIPGLGRSPGEGKGSPLQCSGLENSMNCIVCGVTKSRTRLSKIGASLVAQRVKCLPVMWETWVQSLGQEDPLEKEMATHSSTLAWKIPRSEEPGRLQSIGSQRARHNWVTSLSLSFNQFTEQKYPKLSKCYKITL